MRAVVAASAIGTTIEWYDFLIYSTAASLILNKLFFPTQDPLVGKLLAIGTIGVGFFVRPLGAIILSHFGDRMGRKSMLVLTLVSMGVGTMLIGLLPTYETIGVAAPILLVACRLVQGIAVGGEWGGAVLMAIEHSPPHRRGFCGSIVQIGFPLGMAIGTASFFALAKLDDAQFMSWGWRLPFLASAALVIVGRASRRRLSRHARAEVDQVQRIIGDSPAEDSGPTGCCKTFCNVSTRYRIVIDLKDMVASTSTSSSGPKPGPSEDIYPSGRVVVRNCVFGLLICFALGHAAARADVSVASMSRDEVSTALGAIEAAKRIAEASRGSLLLAGAVLSTNEAASSKILAILDYPNPEIMRPGSILLLAKTNCEPIENCLVARRVTGRDSLGSLQTERYGSAEPFLLDTIQATLLGAVVYAVDLQTGDIRDMRPDRRSEYLSVAEAVAQEAMNSRAADSLRKRSTIH
jgi:MFS family permease